MLMTGRKIDAATALEWGLISRVVPHDDLMTEAVEVLEQCCRAAPEARAAVNRSFHEYYGHYDRMAMEASIRGEEMVEGWTAFSEKRSPSWVPAALRKDGRL
jgi:enoyl-CoA hydratase/carnithine racemase